MADVVTKTDCEKTHEKLEEDTEKAIGTAMASVEARIKIWIMTAAFTILLAFIYLLVDVGTYREKIEDNEATIQQMEQVIDGLRFRYRGSRDGDDGGREP